ncbi:hypothetical protein T552_04144 [Pneumocystis carinii B80]|uniref:Endonuclease GajA/Old nuclease/RecF-like AAA domain-containing protein n=1 Tax=Pneumocystis carinii (strain B80) TaxID=1408658 RepID=A0A0W4ZH32_PNEC8|nr:hypothetical protein T552_04144 [Pneumocystis carinii B80]KTW27665.1 hypothetical protein T552_04144 [Pneumocystis carinii B80]
MVKRKIEDEKLYNEGNHNIFLNEKKYKSNEHLLNQNVLNEDEIYENESYNEDEFSEGESESQQTKLDLQNRRLLPCAEAGIIKSVELVNFMCHKYLKVDLCSNINFLIGHNGSGKSAILTAITVCLGGKASITNRGSNIKDLIREGANSSSVTIMLKNTGDDAYMHDVYGNTIIIERRFTRESCGGYKIRSADNRLISTKRDELNAINDHMGLQVDNPMTVLTQDTARQFLGSSSAEDKYKFFMKGIQLTQLNNDYNLINESIEIAADVIKTKKEGLSSLKQTVDDASTRFQETFKIREMYEKLDNLKDEMAWAQVEEQEKRLDDITNLLENQRKKMSRAQEEYFKSESDLSDLSVKITATQRNFDSIKEDKLPFSNKQYSEIKRRLDLNNEEIKELMIQQNEVQDQIKMANDEITRCLKKISDEKERLLELDGGYQEKLRKKKEELDLQISILRSNNFKIDALIEEVEENIRIEDNKASKIKDTVLEYDRSLKALRGQLISFEHAKKDRLTAFHPRMPILIQAIEQENRFTSIPIGPFGKFVQVLKPEWLFILETFFGTTLNAFLVKNTEDEKILKNLMQKCNCFVNIIIGTDDMFDYSKGEPDCEFDTILKILNIKDELIKRQLIIHHQIESTILIKDRFTADKIMYNKPANVTACYALHKNGCDGFKIGGKQGSSSSIPVDGWKKALRLSENTDKEMLLIQKSIENAELEYNRSLQSQKLHMTSLKEMISKKKDLENQKKSIKHQINEKQNELDDINERFNEKENTGKIEALEENIKEAQEIVENYQGQYGDILKATNKLNEVNVLIKEELASKKKQISELEMSIEQLKKVLEDYVGQRIQKKVDSEHYKKKVDEYLIKINEITENKVEQEKLVDDFIKKASQISKRVKVNHDAHYLDALIKQMTKRLSEVQQCLGATIEDIAQEFEKAQNDFHMASLEIKELEVLYDILRNTLKERRQRWKYYRSMLSLRTKMLFHHFLSMRAFNGKLKIDHKARTLEPKIYVDTFSNEKDLLKNNTFKSLSGGEKSFSTVCLLLSIWEAMGSPIRCLDEFDVFMDAVNRKISISMMINAARDASMTQFILITPQDMSNIAIGPDIKIIKMKDPERSQTILDFR